MDEIHIAQKLVYLKSSGTLVGYVDLSDAENEMDQPPVATKVLAYMVRGICTNLKEIVAAYTTSNLSKEDLYDRTWHVITKCEVGGVKILAVVCDGSATNRSFIQMHSPVTKLNSGVVHDTVNLASPTRTLYFISDGPHLLKTIRNALAKSGVHPKCKRKLTKGGQVLAWKTIERLFLEDHENTWRQSFKLNAQHVYLNSYSCMNVKFAAQVLSNTVGQDLQSRGWPGTSELVIFILKCNNFFDNINGAHKNHGIRTANRRLSPFTKKDDQRFDELINFVVYLRDWEKEVNSLRNLKKTQKKKLLLPHQTVDGIEMTVNSFIAVMKFMLDAGAEYVNGRALCQDPLEQYFGKQRASLGGSNNPTVQQFFDTDNKIKTHRDMNVRRGRGNTEATNSSMEISDEPLPKRPRCIKKT
ncbi:hypothetical protein ONE63_003501 [Megalurothrips usitatus]|uniref:Transposase n=1 Tax=Megalurothrips usitatus TaxID=439358 RepID=A0AAV7X762_9NEOP|nr:hypothetical protein ONE63_003501 [Megalurothrips usitatus]